MLEDHKRRTRFQRRHAARLHQARADSGDRLRLRQSAVRAARPAQSHLSGQRGRRGPEKVPLQARLVDLLGQKDFVAGAREPAERRSGAGFPGQHSRQRLEMGVVDVVDSGKVLRLLPRRGLPRPRSQCRPAQNLTPRQRRPTHLWLLVSPLGDAGEMLPFFLAPYINNIRLLRRLQSVKPRFLGNLKQIGTY